MSGIDKSLLAFISGLDERSLKETTKIGNEKHPKSKAKSRNVVFNGDGGKDEVTLADLTSVLNDDTGFANLKKRISAINDAVSPADGHISAAPAAPSRVEVLAAPLPAHEQNKLERRAAYELAAKESNRWVPIIRANRAAKALVFPAKQPPAVHAINLLEVSSVGDSSSTDGRRSQLEERMQASLRKSGMDTEEGLVTAEKMELVKLTPEAVEQRYRELVKKRALLFFGERKARQQAKIKSKTFRKTVKRERERKLTKEIEASGDTLTTEELREQRIKAEMDRIRERMTLKTRKASKWAHQLISKKQLESGSREEVMQQVRDKDRLRQEIMGKAAMLRATNELGSESETHEEQMDDLDDEASEEDLSDDDEGKRLQSKKLARAKRVRPEDDYDFSDTDLLEGDSSLAATEVDQELEEMLNGLEKRNKRSAKGGEEIVGRRSFAPANPLNKSDDDRKGDQLGDTTFSNVVEYAFSTFKEGPSLEDNSKAFGIKSTKNSNLVGSRKTSANVQRLFAPEEEITDIALHSKDGGGEGASAILDEHTRQQLEVVRKAFAADQVFSEFATKKAAEVAADAPQEIDLTLPGWGSWGGIGIEPPKGKVILKKRDGLDPRRRKDANLANVIIHEKRPKKALKLMVEKVPYPYKSREEYEQSLRKPTGREWNCATTFAKKVAPRVQVRVGSIIEPIKFSKSK